MENNMKKLILCALALLALGLCSCSGTTGIGSAAESLEDGEMTSIAETAEETQTSQAESISQYDVLSIRDGIFYLEDKPFAEISFNKFDLLWQIITPMMNGDQAAYEAMLAKQEQELSELHDMGLRSIR